MDGPEKISNRSLGGPDQSLAARRMVETSNSGDAGILHLLRRWLALNARVGYRPEKHYMRGPRPKPGKCRPEV